MSPPAIETSSATVCRIPNALERIFAASFCNVAYIGGSLSVGVGASDTTRSSWRARFQEYLYARYHRRYHCQIGEALCAIGGNPSYATVFSVDRNVLPHAPALAFVEFCVNDMFTRDDTRVKMAIEGIVRKLLQANPRCDVVLLGMGSRTADVNHARHRAVAEHYDLPFIDLQAFIHERLDSRGETWDEVSIDFEVGDAVHMNDYGNALCFDAVCAWFEDEVARYANTRDRDRRPPLPPPLVSDALQHTRLIDPAVPQEGLTLRGAWSERPAGRVPWHFDHVMDGAPGAELELEFEGSALALLMLMHNNGLPFAVEIDGEACDAVSSRHTIEFTQGAMVTHDLDPGPHHLRLTVQHPGPEHRLEHPAARLGYIAIGGVPR